MHACDRLGGEGLAARLVHYARTMSHSFEDVFLKQGELVSGFSFLSFHLPLMRQAGFINYEWLRPCTLGLLFHIQWRMKSNPNM